MEVGEICYSLSTTYMIYSCSVIYLQITVFISRSVARARIHVEKAIQRIKIYRILSCIPASLRPFANHTWKVCCGLTNLMSPLIKDVFDLDK